MDSSDQTAARDRHFMAIAALVGTASRDLSRKVGCIIVRDNSVIAAGYNTFPPGVRHLPERRERPEKYKWTEHSERDAIYAAARLGVATQGAVLYTVAVPAKGMGVCADCARAIILAGIRRVVCQAEDGSSHWAESIDAGAVMLREAGVKMDFVGMSDDGD